MSDLHEESMEGAPNARQAEQTNEPASAEAKQEQENAHVARVDANDVNAGVLAMRLIEEGVNAIGTGVNAIGAGVGTLGDAVKLVAESEVQKAIEEQTEKLAQTSIFMAAVDSLESVGKHALNLLTVREPRPRKTAQDGAGEAEHEEQAAEHAELVPIDDLDFDAAFSKFAGKQYQSELEALSSNANARFIKHQRGLAAASKSKLTAIAGVIQKNIDRANAEDEEEVEAPLLELSDELIAHQEALAHLLDVSRTNTRNEKRKTKLILIFAGNSVEPR